ncbi:hypothetical protein AA105894_1660 [Asaia spathodeae NBRC 105894]|nr:hypothetical protein AA105894_1660 [Asaia spathodeae NBRC 105894]
MLGQFTKDSDRFGVVSTLGRAEGVIRKDGRPCDIYRIYTSGLTSGGRAALKAGEVLTSVATLGVAQFFWIPIKAGTRPQQHTVLFCYGPNDHLVDLYDTDPTSTHEQDHRILDEVAYGQPVSLGAPTGPTEGATPLVPGVTSASIPASSAVVDAPLVSSPSAPVIYEKAVTPLPPAESGTISLDTVSREATNGRATISTGKATISQDASSDDLNNISANKAEKANSVLK